MMTEEWRSIQVRTLQSIDCRDMSINDDRHRSTLESVMATLFTRAQVAEALHVCPTTIYRWEKRADCPIKPRRLKRNGELRYTNEDVDALKAWANEFVEDEAA